MIVTNMSAFVFFSFLEVVGFVYVLRNSNRIKSELSLKAELQVVTITWLVTSFIYFSLNTSIQFNSSDRKTTPLIETLVFIMILARDLATTCATTLISLYI
jgi:hypothetical protein